MGAAVIELGCKQLPLFEESMQPKVDEVLTKLMVKEFPEIGKRGNEKICGEVGVKVDLRDIELLEDPFVKVKRAELHPAPFERSQKLSVPVQFWYTDHLMQKQK